MTSRKLTPAVLVVLAMVLSALAWVVPPPRALPGAEAATATTKSACRRIDPNLVNGVCLRYRTSRGGGLTWIGTYRAPNGRIFFCIDFLYDSRLPAHAQKVSTRGLVNQLGRHVGKREVAALNYVISTWAAHGSTGSDTRDAAIALIVRELMGDGVRAGGPEVYPRGLRVGEPVRPPVGGLPGPVLGTARGMWRLASQRYGPYRVELTDPPSSPLRLGHERRYHVVVRSASGQLVPGVPIRLDCHGPVACPLGATSRAKPVAVVVRPVRRGRFRIRASVTGPSSDGLLYRSRGWHSHGGSTARDGGVQRGWIAQRNSDHDVVADRAEVVKARPRVRTRTSAAEVTPGAEVRDLVRVSGLPRGHRTRVTATLYGPFRRQPGSRACRPSRIAGQVRFDVVGAGRRAVEITTPPVTVVDVGRYTWVETLPGDDQTVATRTRCGLVEETTTVVPFTPQLRTEASTQRSLVDDSVHDSVTITGIGTSPVRMTWQLHGPVPARDGSCVGLDWSGAAVAGSGAMNVPGDGTYTTPDVEVRDAGCFTYAEQLAATPVTRAASSAPGIPAETAIIERVRPELSTVASHQQAGIGARLRDTVRVTGLHGRAATVRWSLLGPLAPRHGACTAVSWKNAAVAASGRLHVDGDGHYRTPRTTLEHAGCYTYRQEIRATRLMDGAVSLPGQVRETTLVRPRTPRVTTTVSRQHASVGARLHDTVRVRGLGRTAAEIEWTLLGPVSPHGTSCRNVGWRHAPTAARGRLSVPGDGTHRTPSTIAVHAGCYTYVEHLHGTRDVTGVRTRPGLVSETSVVTRPVTPYVPEVPSGAARGGRPDGVPRTRSEPRYLYRTYWAPEQPFVRATSAGTLRLARLGIRAPIASVGLDHGTMAIPNDRHAVGWLRTTATPADRMGASVISGHVSDDHDRPGALWRLRSARRGDAVAWTTSDGVVHRFVVRSVHRYSRRHGLPRGLFTTGGQHVLHIVTCTDRHQTGAGFHYADNLVVSAVEVRGR